MDCNLDATPTLDGSHVISLGFILSKFENESSDRTLTPIVVKMFQNESHHGAKADAKLFVEILEKTFECNFDQIAKKIFFVTSDNSNEASLCRKTVIRILDQKYPLLEGSREEIKCSGKIKINSFRRTLLSIHLSLRTCPSKW